MTADSPRDPNPAALASAIKIDWILLLTGMVGCFFLMFSWLFAVYVLALLAAGLYFAVTENLFYASFCIGFTLFSALGWGINRWIARGLLEGRRRRTVVACILLLGVAVILALVLIFGKTGSPAAIGARAAVALLFSLLLMASFRHPGYWKGPR